MKRRAFLFGVAVVPGLVVGAASGQPARVETPPTTPIGPPSDCFRFMEAYCRKQGLLPTRYDVSYDLWSDYYFELLGQQRYSAESPLRVALNFRGTDVYTEDMLFLPTPAHPRPVGGTLYDFHASAKGKPRLGGQLIHLPFELRWKWPQ
jgi:hypothetical protein